MCAGSAVDPCAAGTPRQSTTAATRARRFMPRKRLISKWNAGTGRTTSGESGRRIKEKACTHRLGDSSIRRAHSRLQGRAHSHEQAFKVGFVEFARLRWEDRWRPTRLVKVERGLYERRQYG